MAVIDNTQNNNANAYASAATTGTYGAGRNESRQDTYRNPTGPVSFASFRAPLALEQNSAYSKGFVDEFTKHASGLEAQYDIKITSVSPEIDARLKISAIVVACKLKGSNDNTVAYIPLLLERTAGNIAPVELPLEESNGRKIDVIRTAGDGADAVMRQVAAERIFTVMPSASNSELVYISGFVIPSDRNAEDSYSYDIFIAAIRACLVSLADRLNVNSSNPLSEIAETQKFTVRPTFDRAIKNNVVGEIKRQDFCVELNRRSMQQRITTRDLNTGGEESQEMAVAGYLDLAWMSTEQLINMKGMNPQQIIPQHYVPRIVLNHFETGTSCNRGAVLLSLQLAGVLTHRHSWVNMLLSGVDKMRDLGVLSIESPLNPQDPQNTMGHTPFTNDDDGVAARRQFIERLIISDPEFAVAVPEAGPETWNLDFMRVIAGRDNGNPLIIDGENWSEITFQEVIDELDVMTNGKFSNYYDKKDFMFSLITEEYTGSFTDQDGVQRSLEEIDYLAMATRVLPNVTPGPYDKTNALQEFSRTYNDASMNLDEALNLRHRLQQDHFGRIHVTGRQALLAISPVFMAAMSRAFAESRFLPIISGGNLAMERYDRTSYRAHVAGGDVAQNMRTGFAYGGQNNYSGHRGWSYRNPNMR